MVATCNDFLLRQANDTELVVVARELLAEYVAAIGTDLEFQGFAAEMEALPGPYAPPSGAFFIAYDGDHAAGCIALRAIESSIGELKRLYLRPAYRGHGLGARLVNAVIGAAQRAHYTELRLDTLPPMKAAQMLYLRLGFVEIPPYETMYLPGTRFYALKLPA